MKYIKTDAEHKPLITGSPNGANAVEIKETKSRSFIATPNKADPFVRILDQIKIEGITLKSD